MTASRIRVLFNASAMPLQPAGAGIYARELAAALAARDDVDLIVAAPGFASINGDEYRESPSAGPLRRSLWEQCDVPRLLPAADVYHGAHMATPLRSDRPRVATVHDLGFFHLGRRYDWRHRWYYRALAWTARSAERVIVPTASVANDLARYLGYPPERTRVIAEAPRAGFIPAAEAEVALVRAALTIDGPYLLCLGTAEPGKRAVDAIRAVAVLRERGRSIQLVLSGNQGSLSAALHREAGRLGVADRVRFAGYVPDDELTALLTGALALVYPSLSEGFGLPPLEAMACGTPVIASCIPALREVLRDAALLVPTRSPDAIADAAERLLAKGEASSWSARGLEHAGRFSWLRAAAETAEVYREVRAR